MPNGVLKGALEFLGDDKYTGDPGSSTNPWCIDDYEDLKACHNVGGAGMIQCGGSYILTNDIDCSQYNPKYDAAINIKLYGTNPYLDFNGYSMFNIVIRSYQGAKSFLNIKGIYDTYNYIRNLSFKNCIFHNTRNYILINFSKNSNYNNTVRFIMENSKSEVYINDNGVGTDRRVSILGMFDSIDPSRFIIDAYNSYFKISGREVEGNLNTSFSCGRHALWYSSYIGNINYIDTTLFFNNYKIVFDNSSFFTTGLDTNSSNSTSMYLLVSTAPYDTLNIIGKLIFDFKKKASSSTYYKPVQIISVANPDASTNVLWNCITEVKDSVPDEEGYCNILITSYQNNKIFLNSDKFPVDKITLLYPDYFELLTTEQLKDAQYCNDMGMIVFDTDTDGV